ncbi:hypothetical protein CE390_09110 [Campylobacter coli]|nr:hypothetical protein [Campylobacter coli]EAM0485833.1 hypothetical protein [Campylobacter jejuni]
MLEKIKLYLENYRIQKVLFELLNLDLKELNYSWNDNINCFSFSGGIIKLLKLNEYYIKSSLVYIKDGQWLQKQDDFIGLLSNLFKQDEYKEIDDFDLGVVKSISCSRSNNETNYFANINLYESNIDPRDIIYLFGFDAFRALNKKGGWDLQSCIKHFQEDKILEFTYYEWADWYEWNNHNGSHHFAVALYHLRNNQDKYKVKARIKIEKLNQYNLKKLLEEYEIFITHEDNIYKINSLFNQIFTAQDYKNYKLNNDKTYAIVFKKNKINNFILNILNKLDSKYFFYWNRELKKHSNPK